MSLGGVATLAVLTAARLPGAWLLLFTGSLISGVAMLSQSVAPGLAVAVAAAVALGGALATVDTATQSLLQHNAPAGQRSATAGIWVFGIGVAPAGQLCLGVLAMAVGVRWAMAGFAIAALAVTLILGGWAAGGRGRRRIGG
jgi:hypothetical protein